MFNHNLKDHLRHVDAYELHEKICSFRQLPIKRLNREEIAKHILDVLCFDTQNGKEAIYGINCGSYPIGTRFYRVRISQIHDTKLPLHDMRTESDAWNPPEQIVRQGRLNKERESLLYTSPIDPKVAVEEMRVPDDSIFPLIVYEATQEIKVALIGKTPDIPDLTKEELFKLKILNDFLTHEFTRDVGIGTEYLYNISEIIAKDYFDLPPEIQDAWCYPSIAERPAVNVCFRPAIAKQKLRLVGVQIATCKRQNSGMLFNVKCVATSFDEKGEFLHYPIGSEEQLRAFPEIQINKMR